jgi:hypothetical protein
LPGEEVLLGLAQWAGTTVAAAAVTDAWEAVRERIVKFLGRGSAEKAKVVEGWLDKTHGELTAAVTGTNADARLGVATASAVERCTGRFSDLLDEDPGLEARLRTLLRELAAQLPAAQAGVSAAGHGVAVGGDVTITASDRSVAAGVIHGGVTLSGAPKAGPVQQQV